MALIEEVSGGFEALGIKVSKDILKLCCDICERRSVSGEELVETWVAYTMTNLEGAEPTAEKILEMERKEFKDVDISLATPKRNKAKVYKPTTPVGSVHSAAMEVDSPVPQLAPASYKPEVSAPSPNVQSKYASGSTVISFNEGPARWQSTMDGRVAGSLDIRPFAEIPDLPHTWKYFYDSLCAISFTRRVAAKELADSIIAQNNLKPPDRGSLSGSDTVTFTATILVQEGEKLCKDHVVLVGCGAFEGEDTRADLSNIPSGSLFPGQVVVLEETRLLNTKAVADKIHTNGKMPGPSTVPEFPGPLHILVAAGPFSISDNLDYDPLKEVLNRINELRPHIVLLIGPVLDCTNNVINSDSMAENFLEFYGRAVREASRTIADKQIQIYIMASSKDACNVTAFPTAPTDVVDLPPNVHLIQDPYLFNINGLIVGATATDILFQLGKKELGWKEVGSSSNRLATLASHVVQQKSFYPLYPPDPEVGLDVTLWHKHAMLPVTPHILFLPSDLQQFVREIEGCLVVNPSRTVKGKGSGFFSLLEVRPPQEQEIWSPSTHISAKIVKI